jgi:uncharacterized delta-60 repeat protein
MNRFPFLTLLFISLLSVAGVSSQSSRRPIAADSSSFNNAVNAIAVQRDAKIVVGGAFSTYNKLPARGIVRLNANGSIDSVFASKGGIDGEVNAVVLQPDGKIIAGGQFGSYNNRATLCNRIVRLNSDGSVDNSFVINMGFKGVINALALQPDGKILVGGMLANYNGVACGGLVRLNADGSLDQNFVYVKGISGYVYCINVLPGGKIMAAGYFGHFDRALAYGIVRLNNNGSLDSSFNSKKGFNTGNIFTMLPLADGRVIAGGVFSSYDGIPCINLVRLNNDGSFDKSFAAGEKPTKAYAGFGIRTIVAQGDGKILAGGKFEYYNTTLKQCIVRLNSNGSIDDSFGSQNGFDNMGQGTGTINTIAFTPDGKIITAGAYKRYDSELRNNIAALDKNGKLVPSIFKVVNVR